MPINKARGSALKVAKLKLDNYVFSHGEFYVGWSRLGKPENLFILAPEGQNGTRRALPKRRPLPYSPLT